MSPSWRCQFRPRGRLIDSRSLRVRAGLTWSGVIAKGCWNLEFPDHAIHAIQSLNIMTPQNLGIFMYPAQFAFQTSPNLWPTWRVLKEGQTSNGPSYDLCIIIGNSKAGRVQASISVSMRCVDVAQTLRIFMVCSDFFFSWVPYDTADHINLSNTMTFYVYSKIMFLCVSDGISWGSQGPWPEPFGMWRGFPPVSLPHGCRKKMTSGAKEHAPPTGCVYRIYNHMHTVLCTLYMRISIVR